MVMQAEDRQKPEEILDRIFNEHRSKLVQQISQELLGISDSLFIKLMADLLVAMGYGGSDTYVIRQNLRIYGEGRIEGLIKKDKLGLESIYIRAYNDFDQVEKAEILDYLARLDESRVTKGIIFTTGKFSSEAKEYLTSLGKNIIQVSLVDPVTLAQLMIDYGVGVKKIISYEVKSVDQSYFEEARTSV